MGTETFGFSIGKFDCLVVTDAILPIAAERAADILTNAPPEEVIAAWEVIQPTPQFCYNCLLIDTGHQRILVDTGHGSATLPERGHLLHNLRHADIMPETVDLVFLSHFHGDHIGGLITPTGELTFPNATYAAARSEWDYWMDPDRLAALDLRQADSLRSHLLPIQERLHLMEHEEVLAPGIITQAMYGHTPGHTGLRIESEQEELLCLVDTAHLEVQTAHPNWCPRFDVLPEVSQVTRHAMFARAAGTQVLTLLFHFPFPGLGYLLEDDDAFIWQPLDSTA